MRSPLVADVWRRARYAMAARAGCRLPRRLNSDRSTPYSSQTTSLNCEIVNPLRSACLPAPVATRLAADDRLDAVDELLTAENPSVVRLGPGRPGWL